MQRCVAIHANGTSEVLEFRPEVHRELRHLGYRRFVVRTADSRALSSAVYARTTPSAWQFSDAAKKLWGLTGDVHGFDEYGEPVRDTLTPAIGSPVVSAREAGDVPPAEAEGRDASTSLNGVMSRETSARSRSRIDPSQLPELIARANHSLPAEDPRKITHLMTGDLVTAAREIRREMDAGSSEPERDAELRSLADRLDVHAAALGSYLRARADDAPRA